MKRKLLTAALLAGISGFAIASNDGFIVETVEHPHEEAEHAEHSGHSVWVQKVTDNDHMYELRMEDGVYIVKLDGKEVPEKQLKKKDNAVIILSKDGGELYEFKLNNQHNTWIGDGSKKATVFMSHDDDGNIKQWTGQGGGALQFIADEQVRPKVMLGIYTDEPSDSLREHLGIDGDAILVERVIKGLSADKAGIKDKDIIVSINGSDGLSPSGLTQLLSKQEPGNEIKIVLLRKGQKMKINTKLLAYDAEALGHSSAPSAGGTWVTRDNKGNFTFPGDAKFFSKETQQLTHEKILEALREEGISEDKIREIKEQIGAALHENVWSQFDNKEFDGIIDLHIDAENQAQGAERRFFAEQMQRKAEDAMRDAQRLTMEYKDGQLLLKRHAEGLQNHLAQLEQKLHATMPEIENELNDRMEELEGRLEELEGVLEDRMESLTDLIESLIERLDED
jgi:PDZ domain